MAGHSKWNNIKRKKGREDAKRGKIFTKMARMIEMAAREGGGDPNANFRLRMAIEKAKSVNLPGDNIERAIKRGIGELEGQSYEEFYYEGYGPGGVAIMLQIMTDNRNRTASDVRHLFSKYGGNLGESGCVAWMFEKKAEVRVDAAGVDEEELMVVAAAAGADDIEEDEEAYVVVGAPEILADLRENLSQNGLKVLEAEVTMRPQNVVSVEGETAARVVNLLTALEEHDDVQEVYANMDITEEALQAIEG